MELNFNPSFLTLLISPRPIQQHNLLCLLLHDLDTCFTQGINSNSQPVRSKKNRQNTRQRKTIILLRQYLRGSAICLHPRSCRDFTIIKEKENTKYKVRYQCFLLTLKTQPKPPLHGLSLGKSPIKNHATLFGSSHQIGSNKTRLHKAQHSLLPSSMFIQNP